MTDKEVSKFIETEFAENEYPSIVFPNKLSKSKAVLSDAMYLAKFDFNFNNNNWLS